MNDTIADYITSAIGETHLNEALSAPIGGLTPRPDQIDTATQIIRWLAKDSDKGKIVECPTGCGKSLIAQMVIHWLVKHTDLTIAFLVSRQELLDQTKAAMVRAFGNLSVNITQGSKHEIKVGARVRVAMEQTIASKIRNNTGQAVINSIEGSDIIFIDEAHHTFYSTFLDQVLALDGRVIGLSATPDDWRLLQWFEQEKILGLPQAALEEAEPRILATPVILSYTGETEMNRAMASVKGEKERAKVRFDLILRTIKHEINRAEKKVNELREEQGLPFIENMRWMVKVGRRSHAKEIADHLTKFGITAKAFVSGQGGGTKRQIDDIFEGKSFYRVAVCVHRFSVGYDAPGIQGLILTTENIYPAFVQAVGRVLRTGYPPQKEQAYILDMGGNWKIHGEKYLERRDSPSPIIPIRVQRELSDEEGEAKPVKGRPDAEELGDMVVLTLPGIAKTEYARMDKAVLLAYCAVEAHQYTQSLQYRQYRQLDANDPQARLKRALTNYWFITGHNIIAFGAPHEIKRNAANDMITQSPEAKAIWTSMTPMPDAIQKRLMKARRKFSKQRRAA